MPCVRTGLLCLVFLGPFVGVFQRAEASADKDPLASAMGERLEHAAGRSLRNTEWVRHFFEARSFAPAWTDKSGPREDAHELLSVVRAAHADGLDPDDYHTQRLEELLDGARGKGSRAPGRTRGQRWQKPELPVGRRAEIELLATDAWFSWTADMLLGRARDAAPTQALTEAIAAEGLNDPVARLMQALQERKVREELERLLPASPAYHQLRGALERYRSIAKSGGWMTVPSGRSLQHGNRDIRVPILRERLKSEPFGIRLEPPVGFPQWFDGELDRAVRDFQRRHGLEIDGVVGPATLTALNVSAAARSRQVELNMERWRRLPRDMGRRHVLVNIPSAELEAIENGMARIRMRVVVGAPRWETPELSSSISHFIVNPYWNVPRSIAVRSLLPNIVGDERYLEKRGFRVYAVEAGERAAHAEPTERAEPTEQAEPTEIDAASIRWTELGASNFPYRLRQDPGPDNALGRMKFIFRNRFSVYLHDTPVRGAFVENVRTRSHGCVRLEKPLELAEWLLDSNEKWTSTRLLAALAGNDRYTATLDSPVAVHLAYLTVAADETGAIHFLPDVYGRDRQMAASLPGG